MIKEFDGPYRFLSNFFIEPDGTHVEGEYQAAKAINQETIDRFKGLSPGSAKRFGRRIQVREDWEEVKLHIMASLVFDKFQNQMLKEKLLATGDQELIEGNQWGDRFWGVYNGSGENHLGKILMKVREALK